MSLERTFRLPSVEPNETGSYDGTLPTLHQVRDAVRGRLEGVSRADALEKLAASDFPNKHRDLEAVLEDETAPSRLRYLAALGLTRSDPRAAHQILVRATRIENQRVLAGVMRALGQIGGREALDAINRVEPNANGPARSQAEFAAILIAHRLGLEGYSPRATPAGDVLELAPESGARLRIRRALSTEVERSLISLGPRPYGIELAEQPMYEFRCDRCSGMVLLNREYTSGDALSLLRSRSAIFAIGALRNDVLGTYSTAAVFLTSPINGSESISISVHLTSGDRVFGGDASVRDGVASWRLHAVRRLGAFPIRAEGEFKESELTIGDAWSGTRIANKARPAPLDMQSVAALRQRSKRG